MKTLYAIRHAKSAWGFDLNDHNRPLGKRGRKDVIKMGRKLAKEVQKAELILTSTASRAFYTALFIADAWEIAESNIQLEPKLYHASAEEILTILKNAPDCATIAFSGHNPGITDFVNRVGNRHIENLPTCGVVGFHIEIDNWAALKFGIGTTHLTYLPKMI